MHQKIIAGLLLAIASASAFAAPGIYEVTFKGEAPVRLVLDQNGDASTRSQTLVQGRPAIVLDVRARGANGEELSLRTRAYTTESFRSKGAKSMAGAGLTQVTYYVNAQVPPGGQAQVLERGSAAGERAQLVSIVRVE
jgi:hypothetical protein